MLTYWPKLLYPFLYSTILPFLFYLFIGWYCAAGVFVLIWCRLQSPSPALPTSFSNNNLNDTDNPSSTPRGFSLPSEERAIYSLYEQTHVCDVSILPEAPLISVARANGRCSY